METTGVPARRRGRTRLEYPRPPRTYRHSSSCGWAPIAQAQIAEGQAATIYRLVHHREPPRRATLGAKVREIKLALPASLATEYQLLVDARNYLAHEVLFDCGGWSGIPEIDPSNKYAQLYAAIDRAHLTIQRVSDLLSQHLVDAGYPVLIAKLSSDGVTVLAPSREGPVEPAG